MADIDYVNDPPELREVHRLASLWATARVLKYRKFPDEATATIRAQQAEDALVVYLRQILPSGGLSHGEA